MAGHHGAYSGRKAAAMGEALLRDRAAALRNLQQSLDKAFEMAAGGEIERAVRLATKALRKFEARVGDAQAQQAGYAAMENFRRRLFCGAV